MPAKSKKQLALVYARRNQYGSKKNTPKKWKWVWKEEWGHLKESHVITNFDHFNPSQS
jgi:hypothetical protein